MGTELRNIHHVGHVVRDMRKALELYRRLGFDCAPPAYPIISRAEGEPPKPFGAANTHATFLCNFVELVTVVSDDAPLPHDAVLIPLHVPAPALPRVLETIARTVATLAAGLARFEGLHILAFQTDDVAASAAQFDSDGVTHSGANIVQRQIETAAGLQVAPVRYLEIDQEPVPEGRLAIVENPPPEILRAQSHMNHPNGAIALVESLLCVADREIDSYAQRYRRYLGGDARAEGTARMFDLQDSRITIAPASSLGAFLPGEAAGELPAFVAYAVKVCDLPATEALLRRNGVPVALSPAGDIFVPARSALGAAVIFRQG
jgi:hypothetical protein